MVMLLRPVITVGMPCADLDLMNRKEEAVMERERSAIEKKRQARIKMAVENKKVSIASHPRFSFPSVLDAAIGREPHNRPGTLAAIDVAFVRCPPCHAR